MSDEWIRTIKTPRPVSIAAWFRLARRGRIWWPGKTFTIDLSRERPLEEEIMSRCPMHSDVCDVVPVNGGFCATHQLPTYEARYCAPHVAGYGETKEDENASER